MRLRQFDPRNIRVRSGGGGRFPGGGGGKVGCGTLVIVLVGALVFGLDPGQMLGTMEGMQQGAPAQSSPAQAGQTTAEICGANQYAMETCNALSSLNETWEPLFREAGIPFQQPTLTFLAGGSVRTGCGTASSAMGPFYCSADQGIYVDTRFYDTLDRQMGARGDFARHYVIAHEYGHHVQHLVGMADQIRSAQQANPGQSNQLQVRMELQADCYAGVWAGRNRGLIEAGDVREGMQAATAVGDDTIMRNAGRAAHPESFTHGSADQRMRWLNLGLETGDEEQCDTFANMRR